MSADGSDRQQYMHGRMLYTHCSSTCGCISPWRHLNPHPCSLKGHSISTSGHVALVCAVRCSYEPVHPHPFAHFPGSSAITRVRAKSSR
eukprot:708525-Rhodomonas_salina.1